MAEGKLDLPEDLFQSKPKADVPGGVHLEKELMSLPDDLKDPLNSENIPLTPQWLYTRSNESKTAHSAFSGEVRAQQNQPHGMLSDALQKDGRRLEGSHEKKDWRRPPPEMDINRRWREEERETGLLSRRERKKEVDRDNDFRKSERRVEAPAKDNDQRSMQPSDKWQENNGRRDSKWSSRWGPDDKEDPRSEKKTNVDKEDAGASRFLPESDSRDKWRPRHRQDSQSGGSTGYRAAPGFGLEKSRTEGQPSGFASGRGRSNYARNPLIGKPMTPGPIGFSEITAKSGTSLDTFRYPRGKLLDIYRKHLVLSNFDCLPVGFEEIPPITLTSKADPLAFATPDADEEAVLEDMWKGNIISSDASFEAVKEKASKFEDSVADGNGVSNYDTVSEIASSGRTYNTDVPDSGISYVDEIEVSSDSGLAFSSNIGETAILQSVPSLDGRSSVIGQRGNLDQGIVSDIVGGTELFQRSSNQMASAFEELSFLYRDPQGDVQGPFLGVDIISWFDQGFFGTDLPVRLLDAPEGTPFKALGEVMPALTLRGKPLDVSEGDPQDAFGVAIPRPLSGQRTTRHADQVHLPDHHALSRSLPENQSLREPIISPDVEEVIYRGRFPSEGQNKLSNPSYEMESARADNNFHHPLGQFLSELEAHQKRPLSTMEQRIEDTWPNTNARNPFQFHDPTVAPQPSSHYDQDRARLSLEESMLLQQLQLQQLQQQNQRLPHPSEIENILKLQQQQQQLLHLQQQHQQQKEQSHVQQLLLEQLLHRQLQESSYGRPQQPTTHEELVFQERLHHHLKQQQSLEQLLHLRSGNQHQQLDHQIAELEYLEALRAKQNQEQLLRLRREQQLQQLQEERLQLQARNWPVAAHQNRSGFDQSAQFERMHLGLGQQDHFGNSMSLQGQSGQFHSELHPRHHSLVESEPERQFPRGLLEAERMRKEEKSTRLLMGLMGNHDLMVGDDHDRYRQIGAVESGGRLVQDERNHGLYRDSHSLENFFDTNDSTMAKKSWSKGPQASEVLGGSTGFFNMEMNAGGDPGRGLTMTESVHPVALLKHQRQGSLPSQEPPRPPLSSHHSFVDNYPESGAAGELDPAGASFMDMLLTARRTQSEADTSAAAPLEGDGGAAARASNKKKGKKGRQIDPSLLGFKVHSNRIMMGEIHRPEDV